MAAADLEAGPHAQARAQCLRHSLQIAEGQLREEVHAGRVDHHVQSVAAAVERARMATVSLKPMTEATMKDLAEEGFAQPVIVVRMRNVGRLPVTVTGWSIATGRGVAYKPLGDSLGPPLSHRLEAGETEGWAVDASRIRAMVHTTVDVFKTAIGRVKVRGNVSLGDGRTVKTRETLHY